MPAKWFVVLLCLIPAALIASQEEDMELFEFLAMYDENDNVFIDAEMDNKNETSELDIEHNVSNQRVTKSESDE